jgi:hypothetical protein
MLLRIVLGAKVLPVIAAGDGGVSEFSTRN